MAKKYENLGLGYIKGLKSKRFDFKVDMKKKKTRSEEDRGGGQIPQPKMNDSVRFI